MDNNSLSHTKWRCKYHIMFASKYRRKEKRDRKILITLCEWKDVF
ncbi:MAG: Transposase [Clostridium sp.]|jgi:putative transposase